MSNNLLMTIALVLAIAALVVFLFGRITIG
jgi:hypothetical protein